MAWAPAGYHMPLTAQPRYSRSPQVPGLLRVGGDLRRTEGGYRVSCDRRAVTVCNERPLTSGDRRSESWTGSWTGAAVEVGGMRVIVA
jgi:hypothetical protein